MKLVIGGYCQGKLEFAKNNLGVSEYDNGCFGNTDCIYNLTDMVMNPGFDEELEAYMENHPDCIIICNEVGGGIVPVDPEQRKFREKTGQVCCMLAKRADSVYRVFCGIGQKIK